MIRAQGGTFLHYSFLASDRLVRLPLSYLYYFFIIPVSAFLLFLQIGRSD